MLTDTCVTIWRCWGQAFSSGFGFGRRRNAGCAGRSETGFAGGKLVAVDLVSLVGVKLGSLEAVDLDMPEAHWYG